MPQPTFADLNRDRMERPIPQGLATKFGDEDATVVYLYDGIIETRDGSNNMMQQFIHAMQDIDELVTVRMKGERSEREDSATGRASTTRASEIRARPQRVSVEANERREGRSVRSSGPRRSVKNWNIGPSDLGGRFVEHYTYSPYGEMSVHKQTGYGDYDGDKD